MKRLRHPVRAIREPFGTAGLTVAILALVLAMVGGAWAAVGLNSKQKKEVTKIAKKFAGKPGAPGAAGANGKDGTNGTNGSSGAPGSNGKSVVTSAAPVGSGAGKCVAGGTKLEVEGSGTSELVCNGKNGTTGFVNELPSGQTEQGEWAVSGVDVNGGFQQFLSAVTFPFPLSAAPTGIYIGPGEGEGEENESSEITNGECSGTFESPAAKAGNLCVFGKSQANVDVAVVTAASSELPTRYGFAVETLTFGPVPVGAEILAAGSWAVKAP